MAEIGQNAGYTIPLQINGQEIKTKTTFKVVNPGTDTVLWNCSSASKSDALQAAEGAQLEFAAWSKVKAATRRDIFLRAADIVASRADELIEYLRLETGAAEPWAAFNINGSIEQLRDVAGRVMNVVGQVPLCDKEDRSAMVLKEPYGVVLGIAPWNAPYLLGFRAIIYALAAGNTTVLKGSELAPRCFQAIGSILREAGLPDGVLNIITVRPEDAAEVTKSLIENAAIKKINFTGSTAVGSIIASIAGKNLKPTLMELGGKASAVVLEDADIELAANECALGAFYHSGQICMATERILVHSSISKQFAEALRSATTNIFPPTAPASIMISPASVIKNRILITQALSQGASLLVGDINVPEESDTRMKPFILENVTPKMDIYREESFGPTVSLLTFDTEEEAIDIANDTEYGLSASVFTTDLATGFRVAKRIESGAVHINLMTVHDDVNLPHGGVKRSGFGRFNGNFGVEEFLRPKTITWAD
ncbi:hypothetical protein MMC31_005483 [Peltigera leucophlebia]|nr:hypothetical protein [Peltigera leucophlebia]